MENGQTASGGKLKLNYRRTMIIGFAFFGILLLWQTYDTWCSNMLMNILAKAVAGVDSVSDLTAADKLDVQYLVGIIMAVDNLAALILLPIFGHLSDKTHTRWGKRMPYIVVGTLVSAIAFPFIPIFFHLNNVAGMISMMAIVVIFMMMYRNPAVALMPDLTPKPLRSKANGIINIMGYIGGGVASILALFLSLTQYLYGKKDSSGVYQATWETGNIWAIELPFLIASVIMVVSCLVLFLKIKENALEESLRGEMEEGEKEAAIADSVENDEEKPMSKANKIMLWLILIAEFLWFMADNGVNTFQTNYITESLGHDFSFSALVTIVGGAASMIGFLIAGPIADRIGRKWTILTGLFLVLASYVGFCFIQITPEAGISALMCVLWAIKGIGFSLVHTNSFPMVVELCSSKKIGRFTGYYYASSMTAQTITPVFLGLLLKTTMRWDILPYYAVSFICASILVFLFVKNIKGGKTKTEKGIEAIGADD
jgi:Na+/melibiose symporter-like transporter